LPPDEDDDDTPDDHFLVMTRRRLGMTVCPAAARCHHRYATGPKKGQVCGAELDAHGYHALTCPTGFSRKKMHDGIRDWVAETCQECTGAGAETEQRVPEWDKLNPRTGVVEEAILDVATRDARTGAPMYVDVVVTCEHSADAVRLRSRANRDGAANEEAANEKRRRYPDTQGRLQPFPLETGGRVGDEVASMLRSWGERNSGAGDAPLTTSKLWKQLSVKLQMGVAECILSAIGPR